MMFLAQLLKGRRTKLQIAQKKNFLFPKKKFLLLSFATNLNSDQPHISTQICKFLSGIIFSVSKIESKHVFLYSFSIPSNFSSRKKNDQQTQQDQETTLIVVNVPSTNDLIQDLYLATKSNSIITRLMLTSCTCYILFTFITALLIRAALYTPYITDAYCYSSVSFGAYTFIIICLSLCLQEPKLVAEPPSSLRYKCGQLQCW